MIENKISTPGPKTPKPQNPKNMNSKLIWVRFIKEIFSMFRLIFPIIGCIKELEFSSYI